MRNILSEDVQSVIPYPVLFQCEICQYCTDFSVDYRTLGER